MMDRDHLAKTIEQAIEPDLEIVDPHHHLWDTVTIYGRYELADLRIDASAGHNVTQTVFVDCGANYFTDGPAHLRPVGETVYVAGRAEQSDRTPGVTIAAIVGHVDLTGGNRVGEALDAHRVAAAGRFRGVRHSGARAEDPTVAASRTGPPPDLYRQPSFIAGAKTLAGRGYTFDAWQYHHQLDMVADLARAVPELTIIVNHVGGPLGIGRWAAQPTEVMQTLRTGLSELAGLDNVMMKLGGIAMTRYGGGWDQLERPPGSDQVADRWGDLIRFIIDGFGPHRCMFESNFPVDGETVSYNVLWNAFKKMSSTYTESERADLFARTARRVYKISPPSQPSPNP